MKRLVAGTAIAAAITVVGALPTAAGKLPPRADLFAHETCQLISYHEVNADNGVGGIDQGDFAELIATLDGSRTKGAKKLAKRLTNAPTQAAQIVAMDKIERWCNVTLQLRCSAVKCFGGRRT